MSVTARDLVLYGTALLVFPLAVSLTGLASSGDGRPLDNPLFHRGGQPAPVESAGK